jgi:multimeric flavodoxin WrbA
MKINIYYGGRGMVDDPTLFVLSKIQEVLEELNVSVTRYNLYEMKNTITTLSQTITEADAVVFATTVEWLGMGGYMQTFLDACWLYADKAQIKNVYMFPVVMAKTYGEKEVQLAISSSWEIIGGKAAQGLSAYVDDTTDFEFNAEYVGILENFAETVYRTVSQKRKSLPSSSQTLKNNVMKDTVSFTPQESEQLSKYASDDEFVQTQKKDIESLASIYKELMTDEQNGGDSYYIDSFLKHINPQCRYTSSYMLTISDKNKNILIDAANGSVNVSFGENLSAEVICRMNKETFDKLVEGRSTFHRAFMTGEMTARGNLKTLRMLDILFTFS